MYDDQNNTYRYSRGDESLPRDDYQPQTNTYNEAPRYEEPAHSNDQAQSAYQNPVYSYDPESPSRRKRIARV